MATKKAKPFLAHQGDVLIMQVDAIPASAKPVPLQGEATLALGETSGHRHAVVGREIAMFRDDGAGGGGTYLKLDRPMPIEHLHGTQPTGEHGSFIIPAVPVLVEIQSQWTDADEPIKVED